METHPIVYIVDDDKSVTDMLKNIVVKILPKSRVYTASNGLEAWEMFKTQRARFIVISDLYMPELNGLQLLKMIRSSELLKNNYFILLTENHEKEMNIKALQAGADDFLQKPITIDQILAKLRLITRMYSLQEQIKIQKIETQKKEDEFLAQAFKLKDLFIDILEGKVRSYKNFTKNIKNAVLWIASKYGIDDEKEIQNISNACDLIYIGKLGLSDLLMKEKVYVEGVIKNELLMKIPIDTEIILNSMYGFSEVSEILTNLYENFDASGIPKKKKANEIPLSTRIIRVVLDFFEIQGGDENKTNTALEIIESNINKFYELKIVVLLDQYTAYKELSRVKGRERSIEPHELIEGLYVTRSIYSESGIKLIGSGVTVSSENIATLREILVSDAIIGDIWIRN